MAGTDSHRVVLFGATGFTGGLTAREMVARGMRPVLAARDAARVRALAEELGDLDSAVADVRDPSSVAALVDAGDVLVSTVGPFLRFGRPAVEAALARRAHYLDSTGESAFIREIFERDGPRAERAGVGLLTAMGYDFVPGNLAGALALREAGPAAKRLDIAYFWDGSASGAMSGGTRASAAGLATETAFTFRTGALVAERTARRVTHFDVAPGRRDPAVSIGSSEHFALPRLQPGLWDVDVHLGWFGPASRPLQAMSAGLSVAMKVPGARAGTDALLARLVRGSSGGPSAELRAGMTSIVLARAADAAGEPLADVRLAGPNGYDLTARFLAWGAEQAAAGALLGSGALGPVDGYGLDALEAAAASYGLVRTP